MATVSHLEFYKKWFFSTAFRIRRANMRQHAKFRRNWSNRCWDIAIYLFFKMAAVRHYGFVRQILGRPTTRIWWYLSLCTHTSTSPRPQSGVLFEFRHAGSHRWRNHPHQIFGQSFQGFWGSDPKNFAISIGLAGRSYNTAVLHCDFFRILVRGIAIHEKSICEM